MAMPAADETESAIRLDRLIQMVGTQRAARAATRPEMGGDSSLAHSNKLTLREMPLSTHEWTVVADSAKPDEKMGAVAAPMVARLATMPAITAEYLFQSRGPTAGLISSLDPETEVPRLSATVADGGAGFGDLSRAMVVSNGHTQQGALGQFPRSIHLAREACIASIQEKGRRVVTSNDIELDPALETAVRARSLEVTMGSIPDVVPWVELYGAKPGQPANAQLAALLVRQHPIARR